MDIRENLNQYISELKVISTHSHHNYHEYFEGCSLRSLLAISYPGGFCLPDAAYSLEGDEFFQKYFELTACRSDAYWMNRALGDIYLDGTPMSLANYREVDAGIRKKYAEDPFFHEKIITDICGIKTLILDEHRDPGMTHELPFVRPAMRMDWALTASGEAKKLLGELPETFDKYLEKVDAFIEKRVRQQGVVTFKLACAYERSLDFGRVSLEAARQAYHTDRGRDLGDYMVFHTCKLAEQYGVPYQFHTGTGQLNGTNAMQLLSLFRSFPKVRFVLLHCSFPWAADAMALAYGCQNVYIDLSWIFTLSDSMGRRFLKEALDMVSLHKIAWGCDTWGAEEGYGALLAVRSALVNEFAERVEAGIMDLDAAKHCIYRIMYQNPKELYQL